MPSNHNIFSSSNLKTKIAHSSCEIIPRTRIKRAMYLHCVRKIELDGHVLKEDLGGARMAWQLLVMMLRDQSRGSRATKRKKKVK